MTRLLFRAGYWARHHCCGTIFFHNLEPNFLLRIRVQRAR